MLKGFSELPASFSPVRRGVVSLRQLWTSSPRQSDVFSLRVSVGYKPCNTRRKPGAVLEVFLPEDGMLAQCTSRRVFPRRRDAGSRSLFSAAYAFVHENARVLWSFVCLNFLFRSSLGSSYFTLVLGSTYEPVHVYQPIFLHFPRRP